jgi:predicted phage tail protein
MPPAIVAAIAGAIWVSTGLTVGAALAIGYVVTGLAVIGTTMMLGMAAKALAPKPKSSDTSSLSQTAAGRAEMVRGSIVPHRIIYGECMVRGTIETLQ